MLTFLDHTHKTAATKVLLAIKLARKTRLDILQAEVHSIALVNGGSTD